MTGPALLWTRAAIAISVCAYISVVSATLLNAADEAKPIYRIACGSQGAKPFSHDESFTSGQPSESRVSVATAAVKDAAPDAVYQVQRFGDFVYTFPDLVPGQE